MQRRVKRDMSCIVSLIPSALAGGLRLILDTTVAQLRDEGFFCSFHFQLQLYSLSSATLGPSGVISLAASGFEQGSFPNPIWDDDTNWPCNLLWAKNGKQPSRTLNLCPVGPIASWGPCFFRLSRGKLEKRLETGAHVVVKTHEWTGLISPKTFDDAKELFSGSEMSWDFNGKRQGERR